MMVDEDNRSPHSLSRRRHCYMKSSFFCRAAFLSFCNHSESRCIFVHLVKTEEGNGGIIQISSSPPSRLDDKAMVFLKCSHASKLNRENLAQDVMYTGINEAATTSLAYDCILLIECSTSPLAHLDLVMQEVYLPLMTSSHVGDHLLDLLHRISSSMQVTHGYSQVGSCKAV